MDIANSGPSVLVVDDDPDIRTHMEDILGALGYRVDLAPDGEYGGSGVQVLESFRRRNADARAILMTGHEEALDAELTRELDHAGIPLFVKPLDLEQLLDAIVPQETA